MFTKIKNIYANKLLLYKLLFIVSEKVLLPIKVSCKVNIKIIPL